MEFHDAPKFEETGGEPENKGRIPVTEKPVPIPDKTKTESIPVSLQAETNHQEHLPSVS